MNTAFRSRPTVLAAIRFNAAQLKTIQEIITLVVFSGFSIWYLKQDIKWNYAVGFFFIVVAAFFIFKKW